MRTLPVAARTPCVVFAGGEWWPGVVDTWEQRDDGWWAFCWVHVWEVREVPRLGPLRVPLTYVRWVPAVEVRNRDGSVLDVQAWAKHGSAPHSAEE
jgi:hypothetical protein